MKWTSILVAGALAAVLLVLTGCPPQKPDDPWLRPKLIRVMRAQSGQLATAQVVAVAATDPGDPGVCHWLTTQSEPWPINFDTSEMVILELVSPQVSKDAATLHADHSGEWPGEPTIVRSMRSVDEGETLFP